MTRPDSEPAAPGSQASPVGASYDVVVVGGSAAGVSAGVGAVQGGARTVFLQRGAVPGGATLRNVLPYCGLYTCESHRRPAVGGLAQRVLQELSSRSGVSDVVVLEGHDDVPTGVVVFSTRKRSRPPSMSFLRRKR